MTALISLIVRERLALLRRGGLSAPAVRLAAAIAIALVVCPAALGIAALSGTADTALEKEIVCWLATAIFAIWLGAGALFGTTLAWRMPFAALAALPYRFRDLYLLQLAGSVAGSWLLYVAPPLIWIASTDADGAATRAGRYAAVLLFALAAIRSSAAAAAVMRRLSSGGRRSLLLVLLFAALNVGAFSVIHHRETVARTAAEGRTLLLETALSERLRFTPPGALTAALRGSLVEGLTLLALWLVAAASIDYRLQRREAFERSAGDATASRPSFLIRRAPGPGTALFARELVTLLRTRPFHLLFLFSLSYFAIYPLMLPAAEIGIRYLIVLAAMPFLFFSAAAGNMLGLDFRSMREMLALPVHAREVIRAKAAAVAAVALLLDAEMLAVLAGRGVLHLGIADSLLLIAAAAGFTAIVFAGGIASIVFPEPVDVRTQYAIGNDAGSLLCFGAIAAWVLVCAISTAAALVVALLAVALGLRWSRAVERLLGARREGILDRLARVGRTV